MFSRFSIKFSIISTFLFLPIFLQTASGIEQHYPERKGNFPDKTESTIDVQLTIDVSMEEKRLSRYFWGSAAWNQKVFPDRGDDPNITGWETDMDRNLSQHLIRAKEYEDTQSIRVADYMDVHRYFRKETDYDAIQETRGLWQDAFQSQDSEVKGNTETKVLKRFQNMVNAYYPGTELSFSEYDYFYWK